MASDSIMNTGWHRGGFSTPRIGPSQMPMWDQRLIDGFEQVFDFEWAAAGRGTFAYAQQPLFQREVGMPGLGGTYEHIALAFDPVNLDELPRKALALGASNSPAPLEPEALNVTVHSGLHLTDPELHWVEMYDPRRCERVHLTLNEFGTLADTLVNEAKTAVAELMPEAELNRDRNEATFNRWRQLFNFSNEAGLRWRSSSLRFTVSQTMLLASAVAPHRISFSTLIRLRLWFSTYAAALTCATELPDDEAARAVPLSKLTLLYDAADA